MSHVEPDPVDTVVAASDPVAGLGEDAELTALFVEMREGIVQQGREPGKRRKQVVVAAAVAGALFAGGAAAAGVIDLRTGLFGSPGMTENDTSEWLRADSPEMAAKIEDAGAAIPLPPGGDWEYAKRSLGKGGPQLVQETGLRMTLSLQAACQWEMYWLDAYERDERDRMRDAVRVLEEIPSWPVLVATDGGGTVEWHRKIAAAARGGNPAPVRQDVAANCNPAMWQREAGR